MIMNLQKREINVLKGWAIDFDEKNNPTYPMRLHSATLQRNIKRPKQQLANIEILHSVERPHYSAVFGETIPPSGISGKLRRYAFTYSESHYRHWIPLLLADRINIIEGILADLKEGKIPNLYVEMGGRALWKYDKTAWVKKVVYYSVISIFTYTLVKKLFK